uniref:Cordon-bleu ubiquitin-like domain-containing protein n=1 Tax=Neogobius melanostomus TaxID=47308 RepID=A0A8C6X015_9GOBI
TKSKAPSPPGPDKLNSPGLAHMDLKDNLIDTDLSLVVVLPGGVEKMTTVHGSKPLMDLLVTLCAKYHLNPSGHTLELVTKNRNNIKLKPNALIGTLDAEKIIIKPKGEDKNKKTGPQVPEATVRMVINYKQTQKTILRVNPRVPLAKLLPAICEKCEFEVERTILLKDVKSLGPLDLSASLNDYGGLCAYRYHWSPVRFGNPSLIAGCLFSYRHHCCQCPFVSSARPQPTASSQHGPAQHPLLSLRVTGDAPKKRRAPQPPILVSQMSVSSYFSPRHRLYSEPCARLDSTDQVSGHGLTGAASQPSPGAAPPNAVEDAQIQTDLTPLPQQQEIIPPNIPSSPSLSESGKKDMATLTDDLEETLNLAGPPSPAKAPPPELESKPKPSNELTRDYIPKVGMTTYTIVPQKSLDKLRYFEVALTLEVPPSNNQEIHEENTILQEVPKAEQSHSAELSESSTTTTAKDTVNGSILQESTKTNDVSSAATTTTTSPAGSPTEVKDIKIPPATKPKPGSFRLPQHKKTPGYYVTSAAEKSQLSACSGTNQKQGNPEREMLPPPPLPPVQSPEEPEEGATVTPRSPKGEEKQMMITRQSSAQPSFGLTLEKLRSFSAPRPYSPATPSRFAQAVSSAVKKSHSSPLSPTVSPTFSPTRSPSFSPTRSPSFSPTRSPKFSPVKSPSPIQGLKDKTKRSIQKRSPQWNKRSRALHSVTLLKWKGTAIFRSASTKFRQYASYCKMNERKCIMKYDKCIVNTVSYYAMYISSKNSFITL